MKPVTHDRQIVARIPAPLAAAAADAARARFISSAAFVRQAISEKLEREGHPLRISNPALGGSPR